MKKFPKQNNLLQEKIKNGKNCLNYGPRLQASANTIIMYMYYSGCQRVLKQAALLWDYVADMPSFSAECVNSSPG